MYPSSIGAWREEALEGIEAAFEQGSSKSSRETELEKENELLTASVAKLTVQVTLLQRAMGIECPPHTAREVSAMSRETPEGEAPVTLVCETFGISRAAFYLGARAVQEEEHVPGQWITGEHRPHLVGRALERLAQVHRRGRHKDPYRPWKEDHHAAPSVITRPANQAVATFDASTTTRTSPNSTVTGAPPLAFHRHFQGHQHDPLRERVGRRLGDSEPLAPPLQALPLKARRCRRIRERLAASLPRVEHLSRVLVGPPPPRGQRRLPHRASHFDSSPRAPSAAVSEPRTEVEGSQGMVWREDSPA
ncbi:MAG TPA: hypothetical protein VN033_15835 [Vulgatibacter sp.]|nr:hypothetical protein [Vulgatibacter sp.]